MEKAVIISRCSTNETRQDVTRQTADLKEKYSNRYSIIKSFEYYRSGIDNDKELAEVLTFAIHKKVEHLLFTEISRITRRVIETLTFVRTCTQNMINVVIDDKNLHTLNDDKTENATTSLILQIGSAFAEVELKTTQQRLNSGRAKYIKEGGRLGRNKDTKETVEQVLDKHKDVVKYLKKGQSVRNIMKLTEKSTGTVQKVKQILMG